MNKHIKVILGCLLFGALAWAASEQVDRITAARPQHFLKGLYVGTDVSRAATDTANKVTHTGAGRIDYAFPALPDDGGTTGDACQITPGSVTVEGALIGDPCVVGIGHLSTSAGLPSGDLTTDKVSCYVSASNTVKVRRCGARAEAAIIDAGYHVRTFSER